MAEIVTTTLFADANLKTYHRFEGNSLDETANNHDGTDTSITYGTGYGKYTQGALFNGTTSKIVTATNIGISGNAAFSMGGWVKLGSTTGFRCAVSWGNAGVALAAAGLGCNLNSAGDLGIAFAGSNSAFTAGSLIGTTDRVHIAVTKATGAINTTTKLYINGVDTALAGGASTNTPNITDGVINYGIFGAGGSNFWSGDEDDMFVFNDVLTAAEILTIYQERLNGGSPMFFGSGFTLG